MRLCIIGTGYVGLVTGACLADVGNSVWCVDNDLKKIGALKEHRIPIFEPGLEEIVKQNIEEERLLFTIDLVDGLKKADICFITVDTPPDGDGRADLTNVLVVARQIGEKLDHPCIIVTKSTVPVGTTYRVRDVIADGLKKRGLDPSAILQIANNPEFLKEGSAVDDFMKPDRVIVGAEDEEVATKLHRLYSPFMRRQDRLVRMTIPSSELSKYAANAMLATRISFMNELARLCEKVGATISDVRRGLGSDSRIGTDFLYAGLGYGGSCLPKDTKAIIELGKEYGESLSVIETVDRTNDLQREWFWKKIEKHFGGPDKIKGKKIAFWGVAFKANTDDVRFAPAITLINRALDCGAKVSAFDPVAAETGKLAMKDRASQIEWAANAYAAVKDADALVICTEWREFRSPDFDRIKELMQEPVIFDGRNLYDRDTVRESGFAYHSVGIK